MPSQNIEVGLRFTADTSQAKRELDALKQNIANVITSARPTGDSSLFQSAISDAEKFYGVLSKATDPNGSLNLSRLRLGLNEAGLDIKKVADQFVKLGPEGAKAWQQINSQIQSANASSSLLRGTLAKFAQGLKNTTMWTLQSNAIHAVQSALQGAYSYAQKLNKGLTDISIVSNLSSDQLAEFAKNANAAAKELSTTTNEYVKGALIYYQQGLNDEEVAERTETTIKMANASGESAETISSYMTAIWNNFDKGSESVEYYADVIALLGATTAASNAQIAEGMQAFAATAETVGLSYEYSAAALTTLVDRTQQSASKIGTSLKTIFARLSSVSLGETLEDGVNLTKYTKALEKVGVDVLTATGDLKDMNDILDELGGKWDLLNQAQKVAVAQTVGGVRQYNNLISLLDNYDYFKELVNNAKESEGYLQTQQDKYAASWEGANKRVKASWETLYSVIINDDFFIKLTNTLADVVDFIADIVKGIGGVPGILTLIIAGLAKINPMGFAQALRNLREEFTMLTEAVLKLTTVNNAAFQGDTYDAWLQSVAGATGEYEHLGDILEQISNLNQKRLRAEVTGNKAEAAELKVQTAQLTQMAQEAMQAQTEVNNLFKTLENVKIGDKHQAAFDTQVGEIEKITEAQAAVTQAKLSSNPKAVLQGKKDMLQSIMVDESRSLWDEIFDGTDLQTKLNSPELKSIIQNALQQNIDEAKAIIKQAAEETKTEVSESTTEAVEETAQKVDSTVTIMGDTISQTLTSDAEEAAQGIEQIGNGAQTANATAKPELDQIEKDLDDIIIKAGTADEKTEEVGAAVGKAIPSSSKKDWANIGTSAMQAATGLLSMSMAATSLADNLKSGEVDVKQAISSIMSIGMTAKMAGSALMSMGLAAGPAAAVIGVVLGLIAAYEGLDWWQHREINALREESEEQAKHAEEVQDAVNRTRELSESVEELAEQYYALKDAGESTYETLDKMREQATDLAERYRELADVLGIDLTGALADYELALQGGDVDRAEQIRQEIEAQVNAAETGASIESYEAASKALTAAGTGTISNGQYSSRSGLFKGGFSFDNLNLQQASIVRENLGDFINETGTNSQYGGSFNLKVDADAQSMQEYYDALVKTKQELDNAGQTSGKFYNFIDDEIEALTPKVEEFGAIAKDAATIFAKDFDSQGSTIGTMTEFMDQHDTILQKIKDDYGVLSDEEAQQVLNLTELMGTQEKLFQSWKNNLPEDLVDDAASYYDNINEAYRSQFGATLDYQGAVTDAGTLDTDFLNNQLSERVEDWRKEQFLGEAENRDLDLEVLQDYADHLANIADESDILADSLEEDSDAALLVARSVMSMNKGVEKLQENFEDWGDVLSNSAKDSVEYSEALSGVKDALADMYEVQKDFISDDFVADHLKEIEKAATGDEDAIDGLRDALADDIVVNIVNQNNKSLGPGESLIDLSSVQDEVANMRAWLDANPMEVGTRISLDDFNGDMDAFIDQCNNIISSAHMTADQANAFFDAMGFETTFVTEPEPVTKHGFSTITVTQVTDTNTVSAYDQDGNVIQSIGYPTTETYTYPGHPYTYTDYVDAIAMESNAGSGGAKVPKIESMTKKAGGGMNNASSRNSGGGGGKKGGGGGGGGGSKKANKAKKAERYHEITDKLDQQSKKIKEISTYEDRAYGAERQKYVQDHISALKTEADLYGQLAKEAENYLKSDKKALEQYGAKFNADGTIKNYDEWYNKWAEKYKDDEEKLAEFEEAIKNYEDSLDKYIDAKQSQLEKLNEAYDLQLKNINDTLKEQNDLIQDNLDLLEYMYNRLNDDGSDAADAIANLNDQMTQLGFKAEHYEQAITDLLKNAGASAKDIEKFLSGKISIDDLAKKLKLTPEAIDNLREYASALLEINENMYEMRESAIDQLTKALDKFAEEADKAARKTEFYAGHLEHLKNVIDVVGKDALGVSNEILEGLSDAAFQTALREIEIARTTLDEIEYDRQRFAEQFANGLMTEDEYNAMMDDLNDRWMGAMETLAEKEEDALAAAENVFQTHLTNIVEDFEKAMSGPYKTLDHLQDAFDKQKKLNDLYVDDYKKIHDLSKLGRDIQKSMDNTDNVKAMEYLKELQDEVNDGLRDGNKLTEYNIEFLEKKYQLRLAEIALEEAQNAKNQVRMTRTSEGDWSYTYYADEEATANAQQNYEDKLFELEQLNQEYAKNVQDLIMDNMAQYRDEIANLNLTDAERTQMLQQYYEQLQQQYGVFLNTALDDAKWIEGEFNVVDHNLINDWDETTLAAVTNFETLEGMQDAFITASGAMVDSLKVTYERWVNDWQTVLTTAGDDAANYGNQVKTESENVIQYGQDVVDAYEQQVKDQETKVWEPALANLTTFLTEWKKKIDEQISKNVELVASIDSLIRKYGELATKAEEAASKATAAAAKAQAAAQSAANAASSAANSATSATGSRDRAQNSPTTNTTTTSGGGGSSGLGRSYMMTMDSGGYTGEWGNEGRIAMLHEKELVLNKTDTTNILKTVDAVRDIATQLSANASISAAGLGELASAGIKAGTQFEQIVNITAEFPGAVYHDEIEQAFDNLLGRTAQFLLRK